MADSDETVLKNRYKLIAQQGSGGMSVIYRALDMTLNRNVALKILRPSLQSDPEFLKRFQNEARATANLKHPNIVTIHDIGDDGGYIFLVLEFVEGQNLKQIIKARNTLPIDWTVNVIHQVCSGVDYANRAGIIHADIKPQNILITPNEVAKVIDFGISRAINESQIGEKDDLVWGSPHYFSPEQAQGYKPTSASDVYSIGIVMFEMLTGKLPYVGDDQQQLALAHIRERIPKITEYNAEIPESLAKIVFKAMSKEPAMRFQTSDQLRQELEKFRNRELRGNKSINLPLGPIVDKPQIPSIFISYSKKDVESREKLVNTLGSPYSIWFDGELQNKSGQSWWDNILREVEKQELFIFALTEHSLLSFACYLEYTYAHLLGKSVLPVKSTTEAIQFALLPVSLRGNQFVDFILKGAETSLHNSIANLMAQEMNMSRPSEKVNVYRPPVPYQEFTPIAQKILNLHKQLDERDQRDIVYNLEDFVEESHMRDGALILLQLLHDRRDTLGPIVRRISTRLEKAHPEVIAFVKNGNMPRGTIEE